MLGLIGHADGFVDKQDRNTVLDAICVPQPRVVQKFVVYQQQRSAVLGADEDAQKFFVEHEGRVSRAGC